MMGPVTHFLFGALCGAAIAGVAVVFRRRWALCLPPFVLACGFWAEVPYVLGARDVTHWLANVFFGYAWLHPWAHGRELIGFFFVLVIANILLVGYVVFLTWFFGTVDLVRWERSGGERRRRRSSRRHPRRHRSKE